ncbi:MAG: Alpha/beta hydrolase [uncultured Thiotrichaceae bacterium]|uniref:Alpha/beta hydrolase n=1 Tax=uncultured Thiotrichaceae bacterium TaxID=298394 RepID=A0A6S6TLC0_9GAMM|nr:MAG: Alpha/beta hydrolase [uncultured Thiotrichaceae bacterium]
MKIQNKIITLFLICTGVLLTTIAGCAVVSPTTAINLLVPSDGYTKQEFSYGSHKQQALDLYLPKTSTSKVPIVFIYGGAWRTGSKANFVFVAQALTSLGHPVIVPDYRHFPEVQFPAFIDDVADAISFVEQQTNTGLPKPFKEYVLMGHSAGAHTAALLATDPRYLNQRRIKAQLTGLIAIAGPYDLPVNDPEVLPVFNTVTAQRTKPILNVHPGMPPTLLLHGLDDTRVLPLHTKRFSAALKKNDNTVTTRLYPGVDHTKIIGSLAAPLRFLNDSFEDIEVFLGRL